MPHWPRTTRSGASRRRTAPGGQATAALASLAALLLNACAGAGSAAPARREVWGFTAFWDSASSSSVARNGAALDAIVTTWIALDTAGGLPQALHIDSSLSPRVPARRLTLVTSYLHPSFRPATIRRLAANPRGLARAAGAIAVAMTTAQHEGAVLDFEALTPGDLPSLLAVVKSIADTLHARKLGPVVVAIPAADSFAYPARPLLEAGADLLLPMLYDQHWAGGSAGPVAEPRWVEETLRARVREAGAERIVAGLPLYGYSWAEAGKGVTVTFSEARSGRGGGAPLTRDSATGSLRGALSSGGEVWVTDATLLRELFSVVEREGVSRIALWYIGQEDPAIWQDLRSRTGFRSPGR